jgi:lipopolysaccharide export system permease protein
MLRLDRYIVRHIFELTGLVALGLLTISTFVSLVTEVGEVGKGHYGIAELLQYIALMMPSSLYILMPIIALLGTLLGVGMLARQGELTAMRAAGISLLRIGLATLIAGAVLGVLTFFLGDWLAPAGASAASDLRDRARGNSAEHSTWLRDGDAMVQIQQLKAEDRVAGLTIVALAPDSRVQSIITAQNGEYRDGRWVLSEVQQTNFTNDQVSVTVTPTMDWTGGLNPKVLRYFILESDSLSLKGLLKLIGYLQSNHLDFAKYDVLVWRKLVEPLTVMAMMLFAIPFVLGRARDTGAGQRLLAGILVGITFYIVNKVSLSYGTLYQWPAPLSAGLPTLLLGGFSVFWLARTR